MPKQAYSLNNFELAKKDGMTAEGFPKYLFDISTMSLNSRFFKMSKETLQHIANQANAGVPVYKNHRTYSSDPSGYTMSANFVKDRVRAELYIQPGLEDTDTDALIARLDAGTIRKGSIQFTGGTFIDDHTGETYKMDSDGWFYSFKTPSGRRLGKEYESGIATATVHGMVNLLEFSIAGMGADPGAGVVKKLSEEYGNDLDIGIVQALCEINNFDITQFSQRLGYDETTKSFSFPSTPTRSTPMATPNTTDDVQALQATVERLSTENTALTEANQTLTTQLTEAQANAPEGGDVDELERQITQLTTEVAEKDAEIARLTELSTVGEEAIKLERDNAKRSILLEMNLDPSENNTGNHEYNRRCGEIDGMTSLTAIKSIATANFRSARNRGNKHALNEPEPKTETTRTFSGANFL